MNIKFIKDSNTYKAGEVAEVEEMYSKAFIAMGYAEEVTEEEKPKAKPKTATKKTTK